MIATEERPPTTLTEGPQKVESTISTNLTFSPSFATTKIEVECIAIPADTLRKFAQKYLIDNNKDWIVWLSFFITIILVIVTADFKDLLLSGSVWQAIFVLMSALAFYKMVVSLWSWYKNHSTIDDFIMVCLKWNQRPPK